MRKTDKIFPLLMGIAFIIILVATVSTVATKSPSKMVGSNISVEGKGLNEDTSGDKQILAVLKEIDLEDKTMHLLDINSGEVISFTYTGGTNMIDKYEQVISPSQLVLGEMVDASYSDTLKLSKLQISNLAWEYQGVNNWSIDTTNKVLQIADSKYKYYEELVIVGQDKLLKVADLHEKDKLTIRGYDKEIWSIIVTKGHGMIRLEDYEDFIGGIAYIGNKETLSVVSDMVITVQEGIYDITLEKEGLQGSKKVDVQTNDDIVVNMGEFKKPVVQTGMVDFVITPEGAELYIDDLLETYESSIELEYGEHEIKVGLGGYSSYSGTLEVDEESKTITIDLVETQDSEAVTDTDTETEYDENGTVDGIDGNSNQVEDSSNNESDDASSNLSSNSSSSETKKDDDTTNSTGTENNGTKNIYIKKPEGANVYFDGEFKGAVPVTFSKQTGTHYITFIQTGYKIQTYTVEVANDGEDKIFSFPELEKTE